MKVNREELLIQLESVLPGLSTKEIIEQSDCFVFQNEMAHTYNDEIACSIPTTLKITAAVPAVPLISILRKLPEDELDIDIDDSKLVIKGKRRRAAIKIEENILLPIDAVEEAGKWFDLSIEFADAVSLVKDCAGINESQFVMTCIHITPEWIEACDNKQVARYKFKSNFKKNTLIRKESLQHIISLNMSRYSRVKNWIHFKTSDSNGLILSCRLFEEDYPTDDITKVLEVHGKKLILPKGLVKAVDKAEIFTAENVSGNNVTIILKTGKIRIKGEGTSGYYTEIKRSKYEGPDLRFTIPAKLLAELVQKHNECIVSNERLQVKGKKFTYVTVLGVVD